jgi:hypothetical protein
MQLAVCQHSAGDWKWAGCNTRRLLPTAYFFLPLTGSIGFSTNFTIPAFSCAWK